MLMPGKCGIRVVGFFDNSKWPDLLLAKNISCRIHLKSSSFEVSTDFCLDLSVRRAAKLVGTASYPSMRFRGTPEIVSYEAWSKKVPAKAQSLYEIPASLALCASQRAKL